MNEVLKTLGFVCVATVVLGIAWVSRPGTQVAETEDLTGQRLFPDFKDPLLATSMEIVKFDEATMSMRPFVVAQADLKGEGKPRWSIPSHENYPADAQDQVADAAGSVIGLTILDEVASDPGDHEIYGVVDPDPNKRKDSTGVGTRVTMRDQRDKMLMSLIIGKEVPDRAGLRYVRKADEDPVYIVELSTDNLSADFGDWIEKDLLKLNAWDIKQIRIRDHSVDEINGTLTRRSDTTVGYDDMGEPAWSLVKDAMFGNRQWFDVELGPDEELDAEKLDAMKDALDDLKIVDVSRKPLGLSADLKVSADFTENLEAVLSLQDRGFFVAPMDDHIEIFSNEGDIHCLMDDGVEYVLRFGGIAGIGEAAATEDGEAPSSDSTGLNRYIFVMAQFNPDAIEKPELTPLPEAPPATEEAGDDETNMAADPLGEDFLDDATPDDAPADEEASDDDTTDADLAAERERIATENQRKQDEYDEEVKAGREKVAELNARFADWYYIISDDVYQKIHLTRGQIVKMKEPADGLPPAPIDGALIDAAEGDAPMSPLSEYEMLRQEGLGQ